MDVSVLKWKTLFRTHTYLCIRQVGMNVKTCLGKIAASKMVTGREPCVDVGRENSDVVQFSRINYKDWDKWLRFLKCLMEANRCNLFGHDFS